MSHAHPPLGCSWSLYTLDGAASLSPPPGVLPTDPLAWPAQHLLDLTASDVGITTRYDLAPALASLTVQSKGFFYGAFCSWLSCAARLLVAAGGLMHCRPAAGSSAHAAVMRSRRKPGRLREAGRAAMQR